MPELSDGEDDDCEDEEQWQWMEEDAQTVTCLFCDRWDPKLLCDQKKIISPRWLFEILLVLSPILWFNVHSETFMWKTLHDVYPSPQYNYLTIQKICEVKQILFKSTDFSLYR